MPSAVDRNVVMRRISVQLHSQQQRNIYLIWYSCGLVLSSEYLLTLFTTMIYVFVNTFLMFFSKRRLKKKLGKVPTS
jgi:hypothetical protein